MEITQYKLINKNFLEAVISLKIPQWGNFIIREIACFKKNEKRWISFPSKQYEKDGEKKYYSFNLFEDPKVMQQFQNKVFETLDKYIESHPEKNETNQLDQSKYFQEEIPF